MTKEEGRSIQFLRAHAGLTYHLLAEWWCWTKGIGIPLSRGEFGQVLIGEAEGVLGLEMGSFDREPDGGRDG
jgi:hypothetical protein